MNAPRTKAHGIRGARKRLRGTVACTLFALFLAAKAHPGEAPDFTVPPEIAEVRNYATQWHALSDFQLSGLHWGQLVRIFVNRNPEIYLHNHQEFLQTYLSDDVYGDGFADEEEEGGDFEFRSYPVGTIFVKENYFADRQGGAGRPSNLTVMIKRERDFDPDSNGWEFIQIEPSGKILLRGSARDPRARGACVQCHSHMKDRDFVFSTQSSKTGN